MLRRWSRCRTNRRSIPDAPEKEAGRRDTAHRTQTDREGGNMLFCPSLYRLTFTVLSVIWFFLFDYVRLFLPINAPYFCW